MSLAFILEFVQVGYLVDQLERIPYLGSWIASPVTVQARNDLQVPSNTLGVTVRRHGSTSYVPLDDFKYLGATRLLQLENQAG